MRVRVATWMIGLLLTSIVAEASAVTGTVTSSLTISNTYTVNVDSNTRIRKQGKEISLSDVKVGDFVQASEIQVSGGGGRH